MDGNKTVVAVKRVPAGEEIRREASLMSKLDHPHILKLLTSFDSAEEEGSQGKAVGRSDWTASSTWCWSSAKAPDLQAILDARGALEEVECRRLIAQLASALCYLRTRSIIHRDVKPANCMLLNTLPDLRTSLLIEVHLKLLDFGFAKALGVSKRRATGADLDFAAARATAAARAMAAARVMEVRISRHTGATFSASTFRDIPPSTPQHIEVFESQSPAKLSENGFAQPESTTENSPPPKLRRPPSTGSEPAEMRKRPSFQTIQPDKSVHGVSPKGTRAYAFPMVANPGARRR